MRTEFGKRTGRYLRLWPMPYINWRKLEFGIGSHTDTVLVAPGKFVAGGWRYTLCIGDRRLPLSRHLRTSSATLDLIESHFRPYADRSTREAHLAS